MIQRGEEEVSNHLSRAGELVAYSGAFATPSMKHWKRIGEPALIELATPHALNRAEIDVAKHYLEDVDAATHGIRLKLLNLRKKGVMDELESMLNSIDHPSKKAGPMSVVSALMISLIFGEEAFEQSTSAWPVELPDDEANRQIVLTTLVVMQHTLQSAWQFHESKVPHEQLRRCIIQASVDSISE